MLGVAEPNSTQIIINKKEIITIEPCKQLFVDVVAQ